MPDIFIPGSKQHKKEPVPKKPVSQASAVSQPVSGIGLSNGGRLNILSAFREMPEGIRFENQDEDEVILLFLRRHFITNIPWILTVVILLLLPLLLPPLLSLIPFPPLPERYYIIITLFYYLLVFTYALIEYMDWFYNISLVTQKRIVDIDYSHIVFHDVAVTKLSLVEDVNYQQSGFIRSLFDFGNVFVQTAGKMEHFDFLAVPQPGHVVDIIENLIGRRREHE